MITSVKIWNIWLVTSILSPFNSSVELVKKKMDGCWKVTGDEHNSWSKAALRSTPLPNGSGFEDKVWAALKVQVNWKGDCLYLFPSNRAELLCCWAGPWKLLPPDCDYHCPCGETILLKRWRWHIPLDSCHCTLSFLKHPCPDTSIPIPNMFNFGERTNFFQMNTFCSWNHCVFPWFLTNHDEASHGVLPTEDCVDHALKCTPRLHSSYVFLC